ncbi:hypothetical protein EDEG_00380 [Edhazardia aedis USNM 41457]|uniref:SMP domain-containing protein n=1 Tax=Edhazardia aedis (strain USNM 41457) TaxID=1003232 RepID=J9D2I4_EDHAE|nr:hypothetical protein EDEG_00380 [Edhazardia aedis USNM 41457]|eukprot:EJW01789.1 hypothetical protein EDEG_00380 [Edhazardia aedis USNM 41457]
MNWSYIVQIFLTSAVFASSNFLSSVFSPFASVSPLASSVFDKLGLKSIFGGKIDPEQDPVVQSSIEEAAKKIILTNIADKTALSSAKTAAMASAIDASKAPDMSAMSNSATRNSASKFFKSSSSSAYRTSASRESSYSKSVSKYSPKL